MGRSSRLVAPVLQCAIISLGLGWLVLVPPATGFVLLFPITTSARPAEAALTHHMHIVARGPLDAIVAQSDGPRDDGALRRAGILTLIAPRSWCGGAA